IRARPPPRPHPFPYTTLFRSNGCNPSACLLYAYSPSDIEPHPRIITLSGLAGRAERLPHCRHLEGDVRPRERYPVVHVAGEQVHGGQALRGHLAALILTHKVDVDQRIAVLGIRAADGARQSGGVARHGEAAQLAAPPHSPGAP